jgi:transcriptional regulator with XRE-family HTH domain
MPKIDAYNLNNKLQRIMTETRKRKGLTQIDVAKRLKKPQSFVSKYETGERRLNVGDFVLVCKALEIAPEKILAALEK